MKDQDDAQDVLAVASPDIGEDRPRRPRGAISA